MHNKPNTNPSKSKMNITSSIKKSKINYMEKLPLILSIIAIVFTGLNYWNSNKKWNAINLGNLTLKDVYYQNFREITLNELNSINWGYPVSAYTNLSDHLFRGDKLLIPNYIIAYNTKTKEYFRDPSITTIPDKINQLKAKQNYDSTAIQFLKHYNFVLIIENTGGSKCIASNQMIKYLDSVTNKEIVFSLGTEESTIEAKQTSFSKFEMDVPLNLNLPKFKFKISYRDINDDEKTKAFNFYVDGGGWRISNDNDD